MLFSGFYKIRDAKNIVVEQEGGQSLCSDVDSDVWRLFLYAMKSPVTRDKYQRRLSKFFEFAGVQGLSLESKALSFIHKSTIDST